MSTTSHAPARSRAAIAAIIAVGVVAGILLGLVAGASVVSRIQAPTSSAQDRSGDHFPGTSER